MRDEKDEKLVEDEADKAWCTLCQVEGLDTAPMREEYFKAGFRAAWSRRGASE